MASKKELEKRIAQLEAQVRRLENMHARVIPSASWQSTRPFGHYNVSDLLYDDKYAYKGKAAFYCSRQLTAAEIQARWEHPLTKERAAWTKKVSGVTHQELAQFVLDGTPIKREEKGEVVYTTTYTPDTETKSVKTDIGDISIEHELKE